VIVDKPLSSLEASALDISSNATPRRFRLLDCLQLTSNKILRIHEFEEVPP
ncbi:hypothetical protein FIBSPDRAFT_707868, partial [Athelia psychrophila]